MTLKPEDKDFTERAIKYRGELIHLVTAIELGINFYISSYFCGADTQKSEEMHVLLLGDDRCSLSSKAQIFHQLAIKYDLEWYQSYKSSRGKSMNNDIIYIIEQRNIFAHRIADANIFHKKKLEAGSIRFIKFKNDIEPKDYTKFEFDSILSIAVQIGNHIYERLNKDTI